MSHSDEEIENFNNMMKKIENTMEEITFLEKYNTFLAESKKSLQNFYIKFLILVIISNHFNTLVDTNYSLVSTLYNTIEEIEEIEDFNYAIIDYAEGLEIEEVD